MKPVFIVTTTLADINRLLKLFADKKVRPSTPILFNETRTLEERRAEHYEKEAAFREQGILNMAQSSRSQYAMRTTNGTTILLERPYFQGCLEQAVDTPYQLCIYNERTPAGRLIKFHARTHTGDMRFPVQPLVLTFKDNDDAGCIELCFGNRSFKILRKDITVSQWNLWRQDATTANEEYQCKFNAAFVYNFSPDSLGQYTKFSNGVQQDAEGDDSGFTPIGQRGRQGGRR